MPFIACLLLVFSWPAHAGEQESFGGSTTCAECHQAEYRSWHDSHHGWALRAPTAANVLGDFHDVSFTNKDVTTHFSEAGGEYFVETDGPDGRMTKYRVAYTVGVWPLQQYLVETGNRRLQVLDVAWDVDRRAWYHLYPSGDVSAGNGLHWTGVYKNWQARCAECHQTGFSKNYDPQTHSYASHWAELTVSCESCHGASSAHVAWAKDPNRNAKPYVPVPVSKLGPGEQANELAVCGPCHSRREAFAAESPEAGSMFANHYNLALLGGGLYFSDGQQRDEVYVLGSFLQSKMKAKGVTCSNCHEPHSGKLVAEGNAICTQCHNEAGRDGFSSLTKANYDTPTHHHHKVGSEAAQCVSCHMPERDYMGIDGRRDHFFRRPDPMQSKAAGSPDACTSCHKTKSQEWAAGEIAVWFPDASHDWQDRSAFIAFDNGDTSPSTLKALADYALDIDRPDIVRASALGGLAGRTGQVELDRLSGLLADKSDLVRSAAAHATRGVEASKLDQLLKPLLSDPVRAVRLAAATELLAGDPAALSPDERQKWDAALTEYRNSRMAMADTPEAHMALAGLALSLRNWQAAEAGFNEAAQMDPQLEGAWLMLARLKAAERDEDSAVSYLDKGLARLPRSIALLLERAGGEARRGNDGDAIDWYRRIIAIDGNQRDALIGLAISALRTGNNGLALDSAAKLTRLDPANAEAFVVAAIVHYTTGDKAKAKDETARARAINPSIQLPEELNRLLQGG